MTPLYFEVQGKPVPKQRHASVSTSRGIRHRTPARTRAYERTVAKAAMLAGAKAHGNPVSLEVAHYVKVPKSWSKAKRETALLGGIAPTGKPDVSNVLKAIEDGLNGVAYNDDSQVVSARIFKRYDDHDAVYITVRTIDLGGDQSCNDIS